jgi:hypothetical protein
MAKLVAAALFSAFACIAAIDMALPMLVRAQEATAVAPAPTRVEAGKLIGREITNGQEVMVGTVRAVRLDDQDRAADIIVDIGKFIGTDQRDVALAWKDLQLSDKGGRIMVNMTKAQLEALPEFQYSEARQRNTVF